MNDLKLSTHATVRSQQRSVTDVQIEFACAYGIETRDGWYLRGEDAEPVQKEIEAELERMECDLRKMRQAHKELEKAKRRGPYVVAGRDTGEVVTVYQPNGRNDRRLRTEAEGRHKIGRRK